MDYTKLPTAFVYKNRTDLKEFTKNNEFNDLLARLMHKKFFLNEFLAEDKMLACFNTAYYICTILLLEDTPYYRWKEIYNSAGIPGSKNESVNRIITLSIVYIYLQNLGEEWISNNQELINEIWNNVKSTVFYNEIKNIEKGSNTIKKSCFAPRHIDKEALLEVKRDNFNIVKYTDYFNEKTIIYLLNHLGATIKEKELLIDYIDEEAKFFYGDNGHYRSELHSQLNKIKEDIPKLFFPQPAISPIIIRRYFSNTENNTIEKGDEINGKKTDEEDKMMISSQTEENRKLKEQLKNLEGTEAENEKLRETIDSLKIDIEGYKSKEKCIPAQQAAIIVTALCHELRQMPANGRENLFSLLQLLWGFTESTSKQALRKKITQKQADKVADKLDELIITPKISRLIRSLPEILEKENRERLQNLNKAH